MTYAEAGQLGPVPTWPDGTLAAPEQTVCSCDRCGALVPVDRRDLHDASHA